MRQVLYGKAASNSYYYFPLTGFAIGGGSYNYSNDTVMPAAGTLKNWIVATAGAPGAGTAWIFTVYKNGFATSLQVTVSGTNTQGSDLTHSVDVVAGDTVYIVRTSSGSPSNIVSSWSMDWWDTANGYSLLLATAGSGPTGTNYAAPSFAQAETHNNTAENVMQIPMKAGTINNLYLCLKWTPGGPGSGTSVTYTATLRVNGVSTSLTAAVTISGTFTGPNVASDTTHSVTIADGDLVDVVFVRTQTGSPVNASYFGWGMTYKATDGNSYAMNTGFYSSASTTATEYHAPVDASGGLTVWATSGSPSVQVSRKCTISGFTVVFRDAPGAGKSWTTRVQNIYKGTSLSVVVSGTNTQGSVAGTLDVADGDYIRVQSIPSGTPQLTYRRWIFWGNNTPAAPARSFGLVTG